MDSATVKQQLMQKVQIEAQTANLRMLLEVLLPVAIPIFCLRAHANPWYPQKIQENCFEKCVAKPGTSLSSSEQSCATTCMEKYMQAWNQVNSAFINRVRAEQGNM